MFHRISSHGRLAPAYDICYAYNPEHRWVSRHALSINGKREHFNTEDFMTIAGLINCRKPEAIIKEVQDTVYHWADFAAAARVSEELYNMIGENIMRDVTE